MLPCRPGHLNFQTAQYTHPSLFSITAELFAASYAERSPPEPQQHPRAHHFVSRPGAFALEAVELPPVVNGDKQLPEPQQDGADQHHAADDCQHDGHSAGG